MRRSTAPPAAGSGAPTSPQTLIQLTRLPAQEIPMSPELNMAEEIAKAYDKALSERGVANVLIAGRSGAGKSTLINCVFQGNMAEEGQGRPVTHNIRRITKDGVPVALYDTRGLEMVEFEATLDAVERLVSDLRLETDPAKHVHAAWVCVSEDTQRFEEGEIRLVKSLARYIPVVVVITRAFSDRGFKRTVEGLAPEARQVVRVRARAMELDEGEPLKAMGLETLVRATLEVLPEGQRTAFSAAQKVEADSKKNRAHAVVAAAATSAALAGATPLPFSDWVALVPIQLGMLAGINAAFGLHLNKSFLATLVGIVAGGATVTLAGRSIVSGLLKMVPGVGTIVGGTIAAATAAALTTAFGEAYVATISALFAENDGRPPTEAEIEARFRATYARAATG